MNGTATPRRAFALVGFVAAATLVLAAATSVDAAVLKGPPKISAHSNVTAEATGPTGAIVKYRPAKVTGAVSIRYSKRSGTRFALGTTVVTITAKNRTGQTSRARFKVRVVDTTPPTISPQADITAPATSPAGATLTYSAPTATDIVDGVVAVNCTPASGSAFAVGTVTVTCSAADAAGNSSSSSFKITVALPPPKAGHYSGTTSQGKSISFDVSADSKTLLNLKYDWSGVCSGSPVTATTTWTSPFALASDGSFSFSDTYDMVAGSVSGFGSATGTFRDLGSPDFPCDSGPVSWTAAG
jgi:hypothetical protein